MTGAKEISGQIEYYARAMKAPRIRESAARLADQAREAGWSHEEYLAAVLPRKTDHAKAHMSSKTTPTAATLPPVIVYVAVNPGATTMNTEVAPYLNIGLTAAEAAGAETEVKADNGWNWGTKTAVGLAFALIVGSYADSNFAPGWLDKLPPWLFYGYLFGLIPGFALTGMIKARIRGRRHWKWLKKAQELAAVHSDEVLFCGNLPEEDQEAVSVLLDRIEDARQRLLADPARALPETAEAKVIAALSAVGDFLVHPAPEPLPATLGMLDTEIESLRATHHTAVASVQGSFDTMMASIDDLELLAGAGASRDLAPEPI